MIFLWGNVCYPSVSVECVFCLPRTPKIHHSGMIRPGKYGAGCWETVRVFHFDFSKQIVERKHNCFDMAPISN